MIIGLNSRSPIDDNLAVPDDDDDDDDDEGKSCTSPSRFLSRLLFCLLFKPDWFLTIGFLCF